MRILYIALIIIVTSIVTAVCSYFVFEHYNNKDLPTLKNIETKNKVKLSKDSTTYNHDILNLTTAAEIATPAVVHIKSTQQTRRGSAQRNPYEELLKEFYGDNYQSPQMEFPPKQSFGSGVILTEDGYIVTNNHVIQQANTIEVILNDKRSYVATIIGTDPSTDLALIKINEKDLPFIKFGKSENLKIGNWVIAVGNPFNLTSTVTAGIVSAKGRSINIIRQENNMGIESFIQTDAVVNPGNSGGALVNLNGELIGINTAIASPTGAFAGYAFAVPETIVKKIVEDLSKYGQVQRALLGVVIQDINSAMAKEKGIQNIQGVYIASVNKLSSADKAGIKNGDIITEINDVQVNSAARLQELIATYRPGDKIKITYYRNNQVNHTSAILQNQAGGTSLTETIN